MTPYYERDGITIYHGDVFDVLDAVGSFDALITDPPYSSGGMYRGDRMSKTPTGKYVRGMVNTQLPTFSGDNKDQRVFMMWATMWMSASIGKISAGGAALVFTDWRQLPAVTDAMQLAGWMWEGIGTWHKPHGKPNKNRFFGDSEHIVLGRNGPKAEGVEPIFVRGVFAEQPNNQREHPTEKPIPTMQWLIPFCPLDGIVFDPFMGSGSTLVAAKNLGRNAIGSDIDEYWCEVAAKRLSQGVMYLD